MNLEHNKPTPHYIHKPRQHTRHDALCNNSAAHLCPRAPPHTNFHQSAQAIYGNPVEIDQNPLH